MCPLKLGEKKDKAGATNVVRGIVGIVLDRMLVFDLRCFPLIPFSNSFHHCFDPYPYLLYGHWLKLGRLS